MKHQRKKKKNERRALKRARAVERWMRKPNKDCFESFTMREGEGVGYLKLRGKRPVKVVFHRLLLLLESWKCVKKETTDGLIRYENRSYGWHLAYTVTFPGLYADVLNAQ